VAADEAIVVSSGVRAEDGATPRLELGLIFARGWCAETSRMSSARCSGRSAAMRGTMALCAREDGEADAVDVLLDGGGDDHLRVWRRPV